MILPELIEIDDIYLRKPQINDVEMIAEYAGDIDVVRYMDWKLENDKEAIKERQMNRIEKWEKGEGNYYAIVEKLNNKVIGAISFEIENESAELGYILKKDNWRKGIATKCTRSVIDLLFTQGEVKTIWATCDKENIASKRVLEKAGMKMVKEILDFKIRPNISNELRNAFLLKIEKNRWKNAI